MSRRRRRGNYQTLFDNNISFREYYNRLLEIAITSIRWNGLPEEINELFFEYTLATKGFAVLFHDDIAGQYVTLPCTVSEPFDIYGVPQVREAYSSMNGYRKRVTGADSVLVYNNYLRTSLYNDLAYYALKLYNMDRTIDVNVHAQKTPVLILCQEKDKLLFKNVYMQYEGNEPVIFGSNQQLDPESVSVLKTEAPFVSDKIQMLKMQIWSEALTYLGIANTVQSKKERVLEAELETLQGHVLAQRNIRMSPRRMAAKEAKRVLGLDIEPEFVQFEVDMDGVTEDINGKDTGNEQMDNTTEIHS